MKTRIGEEFISVAIAVTLAGCGGGGGNDAAAPSAEGVYGGTLTGSSSTAFQMLVLENDEFWVIYGSQSSTTFLVAGFIQGQGASNNGTFTSSSLKDYGFLPPPSGSANATYNATDKTVSGTASFASRSVGFSGGPIAGSLYNYNAPASLSSVSGNWNVSVNTGETAAIAISSTGAMSVTSSGGCTATGTVSPRASGKNVFNVSLTFGPSPCLLPRGSVQGVAIAYPLASGRTQLIAGGPDSAKSAGFMVFGTR